jgi:hypothetical protein
MTRFFLGYDVAMQNDYSAVSVLEIGRDAPRYRLRYLKRFPRRLPYPSQIAQVIDLAEKINRTYGELPTIAIDYTGVGTAVLQSLRAAYQGKTIGVLITAGSTPSVTDDGLIYHVPKKDLISRLRVALEAGDLRISRGIPDIEVFTDELSAFEMKVSESGNVTLEAGHGHDDCVLSVSIALFTAFSKVGNYASPQFITPIVSKRPPGLNSCIPEWMTKKPRAYTELPVSNRRGGFM